LKINLNLDTIPREAVSEEPSDQIINEVLPILKGVILICVMGKKQSKNSLNEI